LAGEVAVDGTPFGRYRLIELIGEGGMGEVWRAYDTMLRRDVAIKILPTELAAEAGYRERFQQEAYTAARLNNPNIIPIHEAGEVDGRLYLVMPVVDGVDVHTLLERDGPMSPQTAVRVIEQAAAALDVAHMAGLVHRDVKPGNLMMVGGDFVYLMDFGIATPMAGPRLTGPGAIVGTFAYMAPERFASGTVDARSDVYSLACVLYECLTGQQPYPDESMEQKALIVGDRTLELPQPSAHRPDTPTGRTERRTGQQRLTGQQPSPNESLTRQIVGHLTLDPPRPTLRRPDIPAGFDEVVATGMAKNPDERYQTAHELALAAREALTHGGTAAPMSANGGQFGHYRLLDVLGQGGMGTVYRARDTAMGRDVAVKVLQPELATEPGYQERFRREAYAAGRLSSPNIIPIYEAGEVDGRLYLVMPVVDGVDVHTVLDRDGPMRPQMAVRVVEQVAAALDSAHKAGLVHRDVKPSNLLMVDGEFVYLIDFGLVHEATAARLTRTNAAPGSPAYMAPERFSAGDIADARADVYSLACVLYECLTAQLPFAGGSFEQLAVAHLFSEPPQPSSFNAAIPVGFDEVIARGLAKKPDDRYQTAAELAVAARRALTSPSATATRAAEYTEPTDSSKTDDPTAPGPGPTLVDDATFQLPSHPS
jgi:serine/threonine protein kinase